MRDNILETAVAKAANAGQIFVATGSNSLAARTVATNVYSGGGTDSTNSTSYTALTGGGTIAVNTGTAALVNHWASIASDTIGSRSYSSYAISGATTVAASDTWAMITDQNGVSRITKFGLLYHHTGLTAGANTFTQQFKVGGNTTTFITRGITIVPL